jgi:hypothetical protein
MLPEDLWRLQANDNPRLNPPKRILYPAQLPGLLHRHISRAPRMALTTAGALPGTITSSNCPIRPERIDLIVVATEPRRCVLSQDQSTGSASAEGESLSDNPPNRGTIDPAAKGASSKRGNPFVTAASRKAGVIGKTGTFSCFR